MTCRYVGVEASALLSIHAGMGGSLFFYGYVANHMQIYVKEERETFQDSKCSRYRSGTQRDGKLDPSMSGKVKKLFPMILETQLSADCIKLGAG